ncbi:MAG: HAD hydrolase family protein [Oscillospiraceae bacterium]|nr:HAD hydrolase family protein [Oscillospiraceae bacterium]
MDIKLIVTDLDRTLLRSDKTVSPYTAEVLSRCRARGVKVVFATARPGNRVELLGIADLADMVIINNGAAVYKRGESVTEFGIEPHIVKELVGRFTAHYDGLKIWVVYSDIAYTNCDISEYWEGSIHSGLEELPDLLADKICIKAGGEMYREVCDLLPQKLYAQLIRDPLIFIESKLASKWNSIRLLADKRGIETTEIAAFGDDSNDIEMLLNCGVGVAVANALDEVKSAADYICGSNDDDGVARWLEENVL